MTALARSIFTDTPAVVPSRPLVITRVVPKAATVSPIANDQTAPVIGRLAPKADPNDVELMAIIDRPLNSGETVAAGFARKERELGDVFARLGVLEARALHLRLTNNVSGDPLVAKFARLTVERRNRLLVFLADARRREALKGR